MTVGMATRRLQPDQSSDGRLFQDDRHVGPDKGEGIRLAGFNRNPSGERLRMFATRDWKDRQDMRASRQRGIVAAVETNLCDLLPIDGETDETAAKMGRAFDDKPAGCLILGGGSWRRRAGRNSDRGKKRD